MTRQKHNNISKHKRLGQHGYNHTTTIFQISAIPAGKKDIFHHVPVMKHRVQYQDNIAGLHFLLFYSMSLSSMVRQYTDFVPVL